MKRSTVLSNLVGVPALRALVPLLLVSALLAACGGFSFGRVIGSGNLVTRDLAFEDFDRLEVGSAFEVDVVQDEAYSVSVTADDNVIDRVNVTKRGQTLQIGLQPGSYGSTSLSAEIHMPSLRGLLLSGASDGTVTGFSSEDDVEFRLSGASNLSGNVEAGDTRMIVSGASSVTLSGAAANLVLEASGASDVDLEEMPVNDAEVKLSGASEAIVNAGGTLDADLSGASTLQYAGSPTLGRVNTSGASELRSR